MPFAREAGDQAFLSVLLVAFPKAGGVLDGIDAGVARDVSAVPAGVRIAGVAATSALAGGCVPGAAIAALDDEEVSTMVCSPPPTTEAVETTCLPASLPKDLRWTASEKRDRSADGGYVFTAWDESVERASVLPAEAPVTFSCTVATKEGAVAAPPASAGDKDSCPAAGKVPCRAGASPACSGVDGSSVGPLERGEGEAQSDEPATGAAATVGLPCAGDPTSTCDGIPEAEPRPGKAGCGTAANTRCATAADGNEGSGVLASWPVPACWSMPAKLFWPSSAVPERAVVGLTVAPLVAPEAAAYSGVPGTIWSASFMPSLLQSRCHAAAA